MAFFYDRIPFKMCYFAAFLCLLVQFGFMIRHFLSDFVQSQYFDQR